MPTVVSPVKETNTTPAPSSGTTTAAPSEANIDIAKQFAEKAQQAASMAKSLGATDNNGTKNAPWLSSGSSTFINPSCLEDKGTFLWCFMTAYPNDQKTTLARLSATDAIPCKSQALASFQFLMDEKLDISISHEWDSGTDFVSNAAQKLVEIGNSAKTQAAFRLPQNLANIMEAWKNDELGWNGSFSVAEKQLAKLSTGTGPQFRMDEAKLFKNTSRQKVTLNFTLGVWKSSKGSTYDEKLYNEIVLPVKSLQWCSAALAKDLFSIEYPAIFSVKVRNNTKFKKSAWYEILLPVRCSTNI